MMMSPLASRLVLPCEPRLEPMDVMWPPSVKLPVPARMLRLPPAKTEAHSVEASVYCRGLSRLSIFPQNPVQKIKFIGGNNQYRMFVLLPEVCKFIMKYPVFPLMEVHWGSKT